MSQALQAIDDNKVPGNDVLNVFFFIKVWDIIKEDVISVIKVFFDSISLFRLVNCTNLILIP